jgi:hypothetical protein
MVEQLPNPPPSSMSPCLSSHIQSPVGFRSEEEQSVGYELLKALRKFKLFLVPPLPSSNRHESPQTTKQLLYIQKGIRVTIDEEKVKSNLGNQTLKWFGIY